MASKSLKICSAVILFLIAVIAAVFLTLFLTILKPRPPEITAHPANLHNVTFGVFPTLTLNATLNLTITVKNPNHGDCVYDSSVALVYYRGSPVAEILMEGGAVPARGRHDVVALADLSGDKVINSPGFSADYGAGRLNFTSVANMPARVRVLKAFKIHLTVVIDCEMSVLVSPPYDVLSTCTSRLKF